MTIDRDGKVDALTYGLLILQYLFGLRGDSLIAGTLFKCIDRSCVDQIDEYMASLHFSLWDDRSNGFRETCKAIHRCDQDILDTAMLEICEHRQPKVGTL